MNILDKILETKRKEIEQAKSIRSFDDIMDEARAVSRPVVSFSRALSESYTGIIAEFKRRSPSKGYIKEGADVAGIVKGYSEGGAAAISILTDSDYFAGSLDDLMEARAATNLPLLRKDFIINPYQICESRIAGADAILLIAAALSVSECSDLAAFAAFLGLEVLLELHDESELGHINLYVNVLGVNNRNLSNFTTDINISKRLAKLLPNNIVRISESGISSASMVRELRKDDFSGFLIGENFIKEPDPVAALGLFIKELEQ